MQIKGTWMVDLVKTIRANKQLNFDKWLRPEDWEIINSNILPSQWYPLESYRRIGLATFREVGKSDLSRSRYFGRVGMKGMLKVYKNILIEGDPAASVEKFTMLAKTFLKGLETNYRITERGKNWIKIRMIIAKSDHLDEIADSFANQLGGNAEELIETAGGKNINLKIDKNEEAYDINVSWE